MKDINIKIYEDDEDVTYLKYLKIASFTEIMKKEVQDYLKKKLKNLAL